MSDTHKEVMTSSQSCSVSFVLLDLTQLFSSKVLLWDSTWVVAIVSSAAKLKELENWNLYVRGEMLISEGVSFYKFHFCQIR
jgi:hypothetical protein